MSVNTYGMDGQLGGQNHMRNSILKNNKDGSKKNKEVKDKEVGNRKICGGDDGNGCLLF